MAEIFGKHGRSCDCGALRAADIDREVTLMGWVGRREGIAALAVVLVEKAG